MFTLLSAVSCCVAASNMYCIFGVWFPSRPTLCLCNACLLAHYILNVVRCFQSSVGSNFGIHAIAPEHAELLHVWSWGEWQSNELLLSACQEHGTLQWFIQSDNITEALWTYNCKNVSLIKKQNQASQNPTTVCSSKVSSKAFLSAMPGYLVLKGT